MYDVAESELRREKRKTEIILQLATVVNRPATLKEKLDAILAVLEILFGLQHSMLLMPDAGRSRRPTWLFSERPERHHHYLRRPGPCG